MKKPTTTKKEVTAQEHFRLRPVTEKPTREDANEEGQILVYYSTTEKWFPFSFQNKFDSTILCWLPGHLPQHLIPKPESAEDRMRREFEEWADPYFNLERDGTEYTSPGAQQSWIAWQAAKKGVQA